MTSVPVVNGMFRGICVDNKDPKNLGRIRVQVPQILGTSASGWAFPAWSFPQTMIWPVDRLPKPGDGVWVMFDSTSPDKMIWMAAFGPLELIKQPDFIEMPDFKSILSPLSIDKPPVWNEVTVFSGTLTSDLGGVPNPNPKVQLSGRVAGGNWRVLGTVSPASDGSWSFAHTVQLTGTVEYRATFEGVGVYGPTSSDTLVANTPTVTFPTTLTAAMTDPSPALNKKVAFSGVLSASTAPNGYKVPAGATVSLSQRAAGGTWAVVVSNIPVNASTGAWSTEHTITIPGSAEYRANYAGAGIWVASQSSPVVVNTSVGTVVSAPVLPTSMLNGNSFAVSGTVKVGGTGADVTEGTVNLWWRHTVGGDQGWKQSTATATVSNGTYTLTQPALTILGPTEWQVRYVGTSKFNAADSTAVAGTVNLQNHGALTKGTVTHTTAQFSWAAVPGATEYEVQIYNNGNWILKATLGSGTLSFTDSGLNPMVQYFWRVRPKGADPAGTAMYGAPSPYVSMTSGRPAVAGTVNNQTFVFTSTFFRCYRNDTGWDAAQEMRQSWFSSAYGGAGYVGIARFSGIKAAIVAAATQAGLDSGSCQGARITLNRTTTGTDTNATVSFYTTASDGTGGRPTLLGSAVNIAASGYSASKTYAIGAEHGLSLAKEAAFSVAIARDVANHYLGLNGAGTNGGRLEIDWRWTSGGQSYVAPAWV